MDPLKKKNFLFFFLVLFLFSCFILKMPPTKTSNIPKTKPTQHGVKELRSLGLSPQMILCRSTEALLDDVKRKVSGFCHVPTEHVISVYDVQNIYHVPLMLVQQGVHEIFIRELNLAANAVSDEKVHLMHNPNLLEWSTMAHAVDQYEKNIKIALIGKYTGLQDSYLSVIKALKVCLFSLPLILCDYLCTQRRSVFISYYVS